MLVHPVVEFVTVNVYVPTASIVGFNGFATETTWPPELAVQTGLIPVLVVPSSVRVELVQLISYGPPIILAVEVVLSSETITVF